MDLHGKHLLEGLVGKGHVVIVISTKHPSGKKYEEINGIKLYYLENTRFGSPRRGWKQKSLKAFINILKAEKIDLVVSQSKAGYGVVRMVRGMGIPFVTIMHGYETMIFGSVLKQVMNFKKDYLSLFKSLLAALYYSLFQEYPLLVNSSRTIAVSDKVAEVIKRRPFVDPNKIEVINYGIDLGTFRISEEERENTRRELGLSDNERVILFLSLISRQKGADVALKALRELSKEKNIRLILAGDGDYLEGAKSLAQQLDIDSRVIFPGFIPNELAARLYNASDLFVFPTLRLESFGIVIAEAMACGKPVIASNIGSIPNVIDNGINGILIPPGDFRELASQIKRLFNDRMYSKALSEKAQLKATERFGLDRMVERTIEVFESAIGDGLKGAAS
jgi:glycosyltransferase involved in cell wall biosynthesis